MNLNTVGGCWDKVRPTNANNSSFPSKITTTTEPVTAATASATSASVLELGNPAGGYTPQRMQLIFYGLGADNDAFSARVIGWVHGGPPTPGVRIWTPVPLLEVAVIMSAEVGIAGAWVLNTEHFCDTITIVTGNANVDISTTSPTGDIIASVDLDIKGIPKIELTFDQTTNTPTMNALYRTYG